MSADPIGQSVLIAQTASRATPTIGPLGVTPSTFDEGQWVVFDPLAFGDEETGPNVYAYALSNPLNLLDEDGLQSRRGPRDRGRAAKPTGTQNPGKKFRFDNKKGQWFFKDRNGKKVFKPKGFVPPGVTPGILPLIVPLGPLCNAVPDICCDLYGTHCDRALSCPGGGQL